MFRLNLTRGAPSSEPENRLLIGESSGWLTLVFDKPEERGFSSYRVSLSTTGKRPVGDAMTADATAGGMLAVTLPSKLLETGDYRLSVEGLTQDRLEPLATIPFRVVRR